MVVMAKDDEADAVRGALEHAGAESIDRAREMWWIGIRDAEKEKYKADGSNFEDDYVTSAAASRLLCCTKIAIAPTRRMPPGTGRSAIRACTKALPSSGGSSAARSI